MFLMMLAEQQYPYAKAEVFYEQEIRQEETSRKKASQRWAKKNHLSSLTYVNAQKAKQKKELLGKWSKIKFDITAVDY